MTLAKVGVTAGDDKREAEKEIVIKGGTEVATNLIMIIVHADVDLTLHLPIQTHRRHRQAKMNNRRVRKKRRSFPRIRELFSYHN